MNNLWFLGALNFSQCRVSTFFELIWAVKIIQWLVYAVVHNMMLEIYQAPRQGETFFRLSSLRRKVDGKTERGREEKTLLLTRWVELLLPASTRYITHLFTKVRKLSIWWSTTHNTLVLNTGEVFHIKNDCWNIHNYQLLRNHFIWIKNMSHLIYQMLSTVILFFRSMYWKVIKTISVSPWPCIDIKNNTNPLSTTI